MQALDKKLNQYFAGKVVRKDLTKLVKTKFNSSRLRLVA